MKRFYYILDGGGGGGEPTAPQAPKDYAPLSNSQRGEWNTFLDYLGQQGNINLSDPQVGVNFLNQYKKNNPNFSLTPNDINRIQYEQYQIRKGDKFGNLDQNQLNYIRKGLPQAYLDKPIGQQGVFGPEVAKLYYPQVGQYGTDLETYYNTKMGKTPPASVEATPVTTKPIAAPIPNGQQPDWANPKAVQGYRNTLYKKYGKGSEDIVDMPEYVHLQPDGASDTLGNLATQAAKKVGIRPELLMSSSLIEGMKGLAPTEKDRSEEDWSGDEKYPISGFVNFGLDNFSDAYPDLVKKGYLGKDFAQNFTKSVETNEKKEKVNSANFKSVDAALQAKAAMIRDLRDKTEEYAKKNGVKLSDRGKDFFSLIAYNGGDGTMHQMMKSYNQGGYLKDDKYIDQRPTSSYVNVHREVSKRIKGADVLKGERYFD